MTDTKAITSLMDPTFWILHSENLRPFPLATIRPNAVLGPAHHRMPNELWLCTISAGE